MAGKSVTSIDAVVGRRIRAQRMVLGLSQTELGKKLGVTFQQVQKYENGTNRVSASRLHQIAHVLAVPTTFFFPEETAAEGGTAPGAPDIVGMLATPGATDLVQAYAKIENAAVRRAVLSLVKTISMT